MRRLFLILLVLMASLSTLVVVLDAINNSVCPKSKYGCSNFVASRPVGHRYCTQE